MHIQYMQAPGAQIKSYHIPHCSCLESRQQKVGVCFLSCNVAIGVYLSEAEFIVGYVKGIFFFSRIILFDFFVSLIMILYLKFKHGHFKIGL